MRAYRRVDYILQVNDDGTAYYLRDIVACDIRDNYVFDTCKEHAMVFERFEYAKQMRDRLIGEGHRDAHIEQM